MDKDNLVNQSKQETLKRAYAFEEMIRSEGWKIVKAYFENKLKAFATSLLVESKPIEEYQQERWELVGIRKLFGSIESDIKTLEDENKAARTTEK